MTAYAHSLDGAQPEQWQPLEEHLRNVAALAREHAEAFGAGPWGELAGLWHDLGKYSEAFQRYLEDANDACSETQPGKVDHSTAGAQNAVAELALWGHLLAYAIAGHHSGLLDGRSTGACQESRLSKQAPALHHLPCQQVAPAPPLPMPPALTAALKTRDAFAIAFFVRMLFSCLADADALDTERFMDPEASHARRAFPSLGELAPAFFQALEKLEQAAKATDVNRRRAEVRAACARRAVEHPGFFSLTVPTGGGKTLSSLEFALRHAMTHNQRRVIYVAPFTSIIEQNAEEYRKYLGRNGVLEHHCNIDPDQDTTAARLAAENWDAPLIVTTSVQFYESLFACRTSRCRKLHRLARSVIILDEAQTLPVDWLHPCLKALDLLVRQYGATVVLCTATQPEIRKRDEFPIGLRDVREIVPDPVALYSSLRRVEVHDIGRKDDETLVGIIKTHDRVLCIVNTTAHARKLFSTLGPGEGHFHLSARMCPAHRSYALSAVREQLTSGAPCRLISTQVVEAGVDLDFPVVLRALAGLDSIPQAAGRCNRNGLLSTRGQVFVFLSEHGSANRYFADTANCAAMALARHRDDPLSLRPIGRYFQLYYWDQKSRWDAHDLLGRFRLHGAPGSSLPFDFDFATVAREFHLIDNTATRTLLVPWGPEGRKLCTRCRARPVPGREMLRQAQRYAVQVRVAEWNRHIGTDIFLWCDQVGILESPETHYDKNTGLNLDATGPGGYYA